MARETVEKLRAYLRPIGNRTGRDFSKGIGEIGWDLFSKQIRMERVGRVALVKIGSHARRKRESLFLFPSLPSFLLRSFLRSFHEAISRKKERKKEFFVFFLLFPCWPSRWILFSFSFSFLFRKYKEGERTRVTRRKKGNTGGVI